MHISRIVEISNNHSLLTIAELGALASKIDKLIVMGHIDIARLILENIAPDQIVIEDDTVLFAISKGYIDLLQLLRDKKGYQIKTPKERLIYDEQGKKYLESAVYMLIDKGLPADDFRQALDLIAQLCSPSLFDINRLIKYVLENRSGMRTKAIDHIYLDVLFSYPCNLETLDIKRCQHQAIPYLLSKRGALTRNDLLQAITPIEGSSIHESVIRALFREIKAHYREGIIHLGAEQIDIKEIIEILLSAERSWSKGSLFAAAFDGLSVDEAAIRELFVTQGLSTKKIDELTTAILSRRETENCIDMRGRIKELIKNKNIPALSAIPREHLLPLRDTGYMGQLSESFIDRHSYNTIFLLLAFFNMDFVEMLCDTNQVELINKLPESLINLLDIPRWLIRYSLRKQRQDLFDIWLVAFPENKRLLAYKQAYDDILNSIKIDADKKNVPFPEAIALATTTSSMEKMWLRNEDMDGVLSIMIEMPCFSDFKQAYEALRPVVELACIIDGASNADFFTQKLAFLFRSQARALTYISQFQAQFPESTALIHDACVFINFPRMSSKESDIQGIWNVTLWADLILRLGSQSTKFLSWAFAVESKLTLDGKALYIQKKERFKLLKLERYDALREEYSKIELDHANPQADPQKIAISVEKKIFRTLTGLCNKEIEKIVRDKLSMTDSVFNTLSKHEKKRRIEDYIRCCDLPNIEMENLLKLVTEIGYKRIAENPHFAREGILAGMTESDFNRCLDLIDTTRENDKLPDITIDGQSLGYSNLYLKKLAPTDPLGFILGIKTNCCQYIGGEGTACAIHGMTSKLGGFYVLFKKANGGRDQIIAQTWAWISIKGNLVFDSIENLKRFDQTMILTFFTAAAIKILKMQPDFERVVVGMGGNTPENASQNPTVSDLEYPMDYQDHRDSESVQHILASREMLTTQLSQDVATLLPIIDAGEVELAKNKLAPYGDLGQKIIDEMICLHRGMASRWPCWIGSKQKLLAIANAINRLISEHTTELNICDALLDPTHALYQAMQIKLPETTDALSVDASMLQQLEAEACLRRGAMSTVAMK